MRKESRAAAAGAAQTDHKTLSLPGVKIRLLKLYIFDLTKKANLILEVISYLLKFILCSLLKHYKLSLQVR